MLTVSSLTLTIYCRIPDHDDDAEEDQVPCRADRGGRFIERGLIGDVEIQPALYVVDF